MAGRIRSIKPELLDDEIAAGLSDDAWRLFVSSWLLADDFGNFRAAPRYLAAQVWQDTTRNALTPLLELVQKERVLLYEVDGQLYAAVSTWERHQRVDNAGKPRVPSPPTNIREVSRDLAESLGGSPLGPKTPRLDLSEGSPRRTSQKEQRNVVSNSAPVGAGFVADPGPGPTADASPPTLRPAAPSAPPPECPLLPPWADLERAPVPSGIPEAAPASLTPSSVQPEPASPGSPADPLPSAAPVAPLPKPDAAEPLALPFVLRPPPIRRDPVVEIFAEYVAGWKRVTKGRRAPKLDEKRRRLTLDRLRHFTEDELKAAARGVWRCEWNLDNKQTEYDLVMRDTKHVEKFAACDVGPGAEQQVFSEPPPPPMRPEIAAMPVRKAGSVDDVMALIRGEAHG